MDLRTSDMDEIRRMLDNTHSDIIEIGKQYPELIEQFEAQYEIDSKSFGKLPTFICIPTNSGLVNTTIRYSEFLRFLPMFKQRRDLIDTDYARNIVHSKQIALTNSSIEASSVMGMPPVPKKK
jgi:hypothetical protein